MRLTLNHSALFAAVLLIAASVRPAYATEVPSIAVPAVTAVPTLSGPGPIDIAVIAGGGGRSAAGQFTLDGTVGQAVATIQIGASALTVAGGFWPAVTPAATTTKKRKGQVTSPQLLVRP